MNKKTRLIIVFLSFWAFIHAFLLLRNVSNFEYAITEEFYPFAGDIENGDYYYFNVETYDYAEFLVYAVLPWMIFFLYRFVKKAKD